MIYLISVFSVYTKLETVSRIAELQEVLLMLDCRIEECAALPA